MELDVESEPVVGKIFVKARRKVRDRVAGCRGSASGLDDFGLGLGIHSSFILGSRAMVGKD